MNKTLYILWFQGFDNSPEIVKKCVQSWKHYNPDWNIILLDNNNLNDYIKVDDYIISGFHDNLELCHKADIIRTCLLQKYGGLWTDATTFCNKPLNEWLPNCLHEGFFAFSRPTRDKLLSNWFLYSEKDGYIINKWCESTIDYYKKNKIAHRYFIHHYLFGDLYKSDSMFKQIWDKVPVLSANGMGPHYLQEKNIFRHISDSVKHDIDSKVTPFYKLTHKLNPSSTSKNNNLYYLFSTIENL